MTEAMRVLIPKSPFRGIGHFFFFSAFLAALKAAP